ncbi:large protein [Salem virus]|uniref:RNA-directed RNA polymerase L n=1 Tax=Salem virus TaxID=120499 RepID=I6TFZ2_9MONO|nr:large protein [Salem virus]AFM97198.1 large protein [Salem virus]
MTDLSLNEVLYPEVHLNSPIVTGKLVGLLNRVGLPHRVNLRDQTIVENINFRVVHQPSDPDWIKYSELRVHILNLLDQNKIEHYPSYPEGNHFLFRLHDGKLAPRLETLLERSFRIYRNNYLDLAGMLAQVRSKLGLTNSESYDFKLYSEELPLIMKTSKWWHPFLNWFSIKTLMRCVIKRTYGRSSKRKPIIETAFGESLIVVITHQLIVIIDKQGRSVHYLTPEHVLLFCDVVEGRLMIDTGSKVDPKLSVLSDKGNSLWELIDSLFCHLGNSTYEIVGLLEPLTLAILQTRDVVLDLRGAFLNHCLSELDAILIKANFTTLDDFASIADTLQQLLNLSDINLVAEFFSYFRTFGHPTLEAVTAADKVRTYMADPKLINYEIMMKAHAVYCGIIINGYRDRHSGIWPPVEFPSHADQAILRARNNNDALSDVMCVLNWKSFIGFHFKCFLDLNLDEDLSIYLKDRALAAVKDHWDAIYPTEHMKYSPERNPTSRRLVDIFIQDANFDPAHLIEYVLSGEYLTDPEFNISYSLKEKEIKQAGRLFAKMTYKMRACQVIAESLIAHGVGRYFKDNGMVKSEVELSKTLHRMSVSAVPRSDRSQMSSGGNVIPPSNNSEYTGHSNPDGSQKESYINVGKFNNSHQRDNRFGGCISNKNDLKTHRKYQSLPIQSLKHEENYETVSSFITTDLQKYCLNWRYESTAVFAERLNEIYGLPGFFNWQHKRLERSILYVADPSCPPDHEEFIHLEDTDNSGIFIHYPMGGIEGYSQKLWTISTIPYLYLTAVEVGVRITALVQGDNTVIAVTKRVPTTWPYHVKKESAMDVTRRYFKQLRWNLSGIGHNLKMNETIISSHFFVYSKGIYYDGMLLSQSLKSISRCVFWSETLVDETRAACSNIATTICKAVERGYDKYAGYFLVFLKTLQQLMISLGFSINQTLTADIVSPILNSDWYLYLSVILPAPLGGFNYLNLSRLFVRNIGDPVTASFADLKRLITSGVLHPSVLGQIFAQKPGTSKFLDWASDPYSANLPSAQSITKLIKNLTGRVVLSQSPNPLLQGLFHINSEEEDEALAKFLMDRSIIIPRAAHEILANSMTGARESLAGLLDTTKGLIKTGLMNGGLSHNLLKKLQNYDYTQFSHLLCLLTVKPANIKVSVDYCSVDLAIMLRHQMRRDLALGRPIYGLEVPDMLECMTGVLLRGATLCQQCAIGSQYYGWFFVPAELELDEVHGSSNSIRVPYTGSVTEERTEIQVGQSRHSSRSLKAAIRIATVYTWAFGDSDQSWEESWYLASQRANLTIDELKLLTPVSTATNLAHRLRDRNTQVKYSATSQARVSRYTTISNDKLSFEIDGDKVDTNFIYQQSMLLGLSILEDFFRVQNFTGTLNTILHLHADVHCCVKKMIDHPKVEPYRPLPTLTSVTCNRLLYDDEPLGSEDQNRLYHQIFQSSMPHFPLWDRTEFPLWDRTELINTLASSLASTVIDVISQSEHDHLNESLALQAPDDIGTLITEHLLVDPRKYSLYLGLYIATNWALEIHYRRPEGRSEMRDTLYGLLIRTSRASFGILINALTHPKIFNKWLAIGLISPAFGPTLQTQDLHKLVVNYLCDCYDMYMLGWLQGHSVDLKYLICESDEYVIQSRIDLVQARHLAFLVDLYSCSKACPRIRGLTSIEKCAVLDQYIKMAQTENVGGKHWYLKIKQIECYPSTLTYLRRGVVKQIRLRGISNLGDLGQAFKSKEVEACDDLPLRNAPGDSFSHSNNTSVEDVTSVFRELETNHKRTPIGSVVTEFYAFHSFRRIGVNSTACYKGLEICRFLTTSLNYNTPRLFVGEGAGSIMSTFSLYFPGSTTYYNTGVSSEVGIGQRELTVEPAEPYLINRTRASGSMNKIEYIPLFNGSPDVTWIGNDQTYIYILSAIKPSSLGLMHSDIEGSWEKSPEQIAREYAHILSLSLLLLDLDGILVQKLMPKGNDHTVSYIKLILQYFSGVYFFYPTYSNPCSTEVYLVALYPRMNKLISPDKIFTAILRPAENWGSSLVEHILSVKGKHLVRYQSALTSTVKDSRTDMSLNRLNDMEKWLLNQGFELNGPWVLEKFACSQLLTDEDAFSRSIQSQLREAAYWIKEGLPDSLFMMPYQVRFESQIAETLRSLARRVTVLWFFRSSREEGCSLLRSIVRSRKLVVSSVSPQSVFLRNKSYTAIIWDYLGPAGIIIHLETPEQKLWQKLFGYRCLLTDTT